MEVRRTVGVNLDVTDGDAVLLDGITETFLWSALYGVAHAFEGEYVPMNATTLDDETAIGEKSLHQNHNLGDGDGPVGLCVNSGPMTLDGSDAPGLAEPRTGGHADSHRCRGGWLNR